MDSWEISFYYNNERVGFHLVSNAHKYETRPFIDIQSGVCKFATDISFSKYKVSKVSLHGTNSWNLKHLCFVFKSTFSRSANLKKGMLYEFADDELGLLVPASILQINRDTKMILLKLENEEPTVIWIDPLSPNLHPCGFWKYISNNMSLESLGNYKRLQGLVWTRGEFGSGVF